MTDPEGLLLDGPFISGEGTLSFTLAPFVSGLARILVEVPLNPKPEIRNTRPEARNQKPETRNQKPAVRNPKFEA